MVLSPAALEVCIGRVAGAGEMGEPPLSASTERAALAVDVVSCLTPSALTGGRCLAEGGEGELDGPSQSSSEIVKSSCSSS